MPQLGSLATTLAFLTAVLAFAALAWGAYRKDRSLIHLGYRALDTVFFLVLFASALLLFLLVSRDFSVRYVADYTSRDLPLLYTISAFWAGQAGSLLFWELILSIYTVLVLWLYRKHPHLPVISAIIAGVHIFFTLLLTFLTRPFDTFPFPPPDGAGLNPLLQDPAMALHPPTLYLGYVGFTIPFAFAMAALILRKADAEWIRRTRVWTIISWLFLTTGIVLGGQWAYIELGWGGYWAWDPVENAAFLPWLTATAFLHSVMIQQAKGMLKTWNIALIALTFFFTIFGTFLTRSGVVQSVHAFAESNLGTYFLVFLGIVVIFSVYLILTRSHLLKSEASFEGILAKETSFLVNNILFLGLAFATFWGTIFPILSEAVTGNKVTVGPPFFNQVNAPIFLGVIILMGICPLIAWRRSSPGKLGRNLLVPGIVGLISFAAFFLQTHRFGVSLAYASSVFVIASILYDFAIEAKVRRSFHPEEPVPQAIWHLMRARSRKYGGYLVHLGVVIMAIGIVASNAFKQETTVKLEPGEQAEFAGFVLRYKGIEFQHEPGKVIASGTLEVQPSDHGSPSSVPLWVLRPAKVFYRTADQPHTEVDIRRIGVDDLYTILAGYQTGSDKENFATFKFLYMPGVNLIWWGFYVIIIGGLFALFGKGKPRKRKTRRATS